MSEEPQLLTLRQAAERLGIEPDTLRQAANANRIAAVKLGRDWFVAPAEVERYARERRPKPQRPAKESPE